MAFFTLLLMAFSLASCDILSGPKAPSSNPGSDNYPRPDVTWSVRDLPTWADAVSGITNGGDGKIHAINVTGNVTIPPTAVLTNTFGSIKDLTVIIQGTGTLSISGNGYLLLIGDGQTVIAKDITLQGRDNNVSLVDVWTGGTFRMEGSARLIGNTNSSNNSDNFAGGVRVLGGTFILKDRAEVSGNTVIANGMNREALGGGVYVNPGTFTMEGGSVTANTANGGIYGSARGGGVFVADNGTFIMHNGSISGNTVTGAINAWGGGVLGDLTMHNGTISNNTASANNSQSSIVVEARGGGVNGNVTMHNGTISGNSVIAGRTFGNNDVYASGGGVYGQLTMTGGTISGNTVSASNNVNAGKVSVEGGGVYTGASFSKSGGTIYGNAAIDDLRNIAIGGRGHAVYRFAFSSSDSWRNALAGPNDNSDRLDFWLNEVDITYTVSAEAAPSTAFVFTFSEDPGNLQANQIILGENASRGNASLTGSGNTRTLSPVNISGNGIVIVSILSMYKVETGSKNVLLIPVTPAVRTPEPSASTIKLSWEPVFLATGYRIYRGSNASGNFSLLETTPSTTYTDIRLPLTTRYFYRVTAYNSAGESVVPAQVSATTLSDNTSQIIAVSSDTIVVEWPRDGGTDTLIRVNNALYNIAGRLFQSIMGLPIPPSGSSRSSYVIYRNGTVVREIDIPTRLAWAVSFPPVTIVQDSSLLNHFYVDTGLNPNTTYTYRVAAKVHLEFGSLEFNQQETGDVMEGSATTLQAALR